MNFMGLLLLAEPLGLLAGAVFLFAKLRGEVLAKVLRLGDLADLDLGPFEGGALEPLDRLRHRLALPEPEAGHELLGFREGTVDHGLLAALELHARALRAGPEALAREHDARLHKLLVE